MRVGVKRKPEVADVVGCVHGQRLGAQQHGFQQRRIGTFADLAEECREIARLHGRPWRHPQFEFLEEFEQVRVLRFRRLVVNAIRRGHLLLEQKTRGLDVRRDHAFFDQLVRVVALDHTGLHNFALRAQHEAHFSRFEFNRTTRTARFRQHLIQLVQTLDLRQL